MKSLTAVVVIALALVAAVSSRNVVSKNADKDFLVKQKFVLEMLQHVYQDDVFTTKYDTTYYEYKPWEHLTDYRHADKMQTFFDLWHEQPMHDDEIFTIYNDRHTQYLMGVGGLFFYAKDWTTFTHAVFWARMHCNKQVFIHALHFATLFRPDMTGIVMPAIYEIMPHFFFDVETLEMAEKYKMHGFHHVKKLDNIYNVVIKSNYTNHYGNINDEHTLAYLTEDIGMNAFYYYFNLDYAYFAHGPEGFEFDKDRRGELYLYMHSQILARYYLERLSNDMGEIPTFNMYSEYDVGFYPAMHYYRGVSFPERHNHFSFYHHENLDLIREVETFYHRIMDWIHKNEQPTVEAINVLGNMIQGNVDSPNLKYYGSLDKLFRDIVSEGYRYGPQHEELPGTIMHTETSLRDPVFYSIYKEITKLYWHMMDTYPEYTKKDFTFEGVKVDTVNVPEAITTYFEYFDSDISNAVLVEAPVEESKDTLVSFGRNSHYEGESYVIKARQKRLNHKPFEFSMDVTSDKAQPAVVKIFIGPKYDENGQLMYLEENYMNFFELDHFKVDLVAGHNTIKRNSEDFTFWVNDRTTYLELYQKVFDATNTDYKFPLNQVEAHCGVPNRMMMPKGKKGGMTYNMFFMVYPYHEPSVKQFTGYDPIVSCGVGSGARYVDALPFGFPFNRPVKHYFNFKVDNFVFHDVVIYHKDEAFNAVKQHH